MGKKKIINDPIYGLISFPYAILYSIIDHPYFQRLRRISQMGLSHYVYPGATHTRFHHALGALHLMTIAIETLRWKGVEITEDEAEAVCIAILLHDIGHGPFSHALEKKFLPYTHEELSLQFMHKLNSEYKGKLDLAIKIFTNQYEKAFLYQLVSGQLDMDRMDYLIRDSYYTGVAEGVIGYDRIIKMLNVVANNLVVEEKGIYSVEKFLMSRRLMYFQVYLHKTSVIAEQMLKLFVNEYFKKYDPFNFLMIQSGTPDSISDQLLHKYSLIDDHDILMLIKKSIDSTEPLLNYLANSLLHRKLFTIKISDNPLPEKVINSIKDEISNLNLNNEITSVLPIIDKEVNLAYSVGYEEVLILTKKGDVVPFGMISTFPLIGMKKNMHFAVYPRL
jgi:HD superfamily phosphohydrolase